MQSPQASVPDLPGSGVCAGKAHTSHTSIASQPSARPLAPAVCRLPALGKLFMLHLGPSAPSGQEGALATGAFRLPFRTGGPEDR